MNKQQILDAIEKFISSNGLQAITGDILNVLMKAITNIIPDEIMLTSSFGGVVNPSSNIVVIANKPKWYIANPGTYPQANNLVLEEKKLNILSFDGTVWDKASVDLPERHVTEKFDPTNSVDPQGGKQIADRYDFLIDVNKDYVLDKVPPAPIIKSIDFSYAVFGGKFLKFDNSIQNNSAYPAIGVIHNLDTVNYYKLRIKDMVNITPGNFPAIVGVKNDGTVYSILLYTDPDFTGEKEFDLKDTKAISLQVLEGSPPTIELFQSVKENISSKKYVDDKLQVLDSFINPYEVLWQDLAMPQPGEIDGAIINTSWAQYAAPGVANGSILFSNIPSDFDLLEVEGNFNQAGAGCLWVGAYKNSTYLYEQLLKGQAGSGKKVFKIDRIRHEAFIYSRVYGDHKVRIGKTVKLPIVKDSIKTYIDNHISSGSATSNEKKAQIKRPTKVLRLEFTTTDSIPVDKTTIASGEVLITDMEGLGIKKFATIEVQGSSSAIYPKKNWTFALYNDKAKTDSFKLRIGGWCEHSEFVFKSNWIDATHARNLVSNAIWEDIVQSRSYFPKRENERPYTEGDAQQLGRFDSGALTHVDGVPCELYINGGFYGIGNFNLGKKRENYDLKSSNQNHIQLAAETHADFYVYKPIEWEIRNPKTPDANFQTKIKAWFDSNALTGTAFKSGFEANHDLKNAIDFYLLAEFIQSPDMYTKNLMVTSWDGVKFYFLPYDMDTTFGLQWDGGSFTGWTASIRSAGFWQKFYTAYSAEIKARYADLKAKGVFTLNNVYKHADKINKAFGVELYQKEQAAWTSVPSNSTIYTGFSQIYDWTKKRIDWLDTQYS